MLNPEQVAREKINEQLKTAGWTIQSFHQFNPSSNKGIAAVGISLLLIVN